MTYYLSYFPSRKINIVALQSCFAGEHNYLLQTSFKEFLYGVTGKAVKSLNNSNQQLMKTQIMLQETASALKSCSNNMNIVHNKLSTSLANTVIPDIKIQLPPPIPRSY
ncbi:hypothetical protein WDU94_001344 [Cyamophila willieti]